MIFTILNPVHTVLACSYSFHCLNHLISSILLIFYSFSIFSSGCIPSIQPNSFPTILKEILLKNAKRKKETERKFRKIFHSLQFFIKIFLNLFPFVFAFYFFCVSVLLYCIRERNIFTRSASATTVISFHGLLSPIRKRKRRIKIFVQKNGK